MSSVLVQIFIRNIVLWHLARANLPFISGLGVLHARHNVGFESVTFLEQLVDTLRICTFDSGYSLLISRLFARMRPQSLPWECSTRSQFSLSSRCFRSVGHLIGGFLLAEARRFCRYTLPSILLLRQFLLGLLLRWSHFANGGSLRFRS